MPTSLTPWLAAALTALVATACAPSCDSVCNKLIRCDVVDNLNPLECEESCARQDAQYELEDDKTLERAFADHRRCIGSSTCDELEDGACYEEELFQF